VEGWVRVRGGGTGSASVSLPADFSGDGAFVVLSTGGDGNSRRQGWAIRGLCIDTRDKKERVDFARGVALESCFFLHFLHEHNCALIVPSSSIF